MRKWHLKKLMKKVTMKFLYIKFNELQEYLIEKELAIKKDDFCRIIDDEKEEECDEIMK